jgi:hypothetical protein
MENFHKLLKRQLSKYIGEEEIPEKFMSFIQAVNSAYIEFEKDTVDTTMWNPLHFAVYY